MAQPLEILLLLVVALYLQVCSAKDFRGLEEYTSDSYPDSLIHWTVCGLNQPGLACDPNNQLVDIDNGINYINDFLHKIRSSTKCICENSQLPLELKPENATKCSEGVGFTLSVAVLKKMANIDKISSKQKLTNLFSNALLKRLKRGQCNDDALLVLSVDDNAIWTTTNPPIESLLTPQFIINASLKAQDLFVTGNYTKGLLKVLRQFAVQLGMPLAEADKGITTDKTMESEWVRKIFPDTVSKSGWRWPLIALLGIILGLIFFSIYCFVRRKSGGTPPKHRPIPESD